MDPFQAILLGIVQGLTEFLPISSTGHLRIIPAFFGWEDPGAAFTAVTQLGTVLAILIYFRQDLWRIVTATSKSVRGERWRSADLDAKIGWYIIIGTIPIGICGLAFRSVIEDGARSLYVIGIALIVFSFVILRAEAAGKQERKIEDITARDGLMIGVFQAIALIPGVSRSGATISGGLLLGFNRADAARYSFLLSIPAVVLSGLLQLKDIGDDSGANAGVAPTVIATVLAFAVGYATIEFMLRFVTRHSIGVFCGYRVAMGALVLLLVGTGVIA
ncbi:Undecaprenyl-diphosphatase [Paraconexibacter sp. AEG42_29]|uniref:Undecaprenyl-diphosphatase n=1 Tax=Paraconexibacter sp. AEG42_29 TaxID=2997339 RepID=A0AAU7B1X1_9ACTN